MDLSSVVGFTEYLGLTPDPGTKISVSFSANDAAKPFVSENTQMWNFFKPHLRKRLDEIKTDAAFKDRVHSALLEMLPSGQTTAEALAQKLLMSKRTLQRHLNQEGTNFKEVLASVRRELALQDITDSELPYTQISFLLGYEDPNSFFRAFSKWTGSTPDNLRRLSG